MSREALSHLSVAVGIRFHEMVVEGTPDQQAFARNHNARNRRIEELTGIVTRGIGGRGERGKKWEDARSNLGKLLKEENKDHETLEKAKGVPASPFKLHLPARKEPRATKPPNLSFSQLFRVGAKCVRPSATSKSHRR